MQKLFYLAHIKIQKNQIKFKFQWAKFRKRKM